MKSLCKKSEEVDAETPKDGETVAAEEAPPGDTEAMPSEEATEIDVADTVADTDADTGDIDGTAKVADSVDVVDTEDTGDTAEEVVAADDSVEAPELATEPMTQDADDTIE